MAKKPICSIPNCDKPTRARGWCGAHYMRWLTHGDPLGGGPAKTKEGLPLNWIRQHLNRADDECLAWPFSTGNRRPRIWFNGRMASACRIMCEFAHGPAPTPKHEAAHSCGKGHEGCIHPRHLYWATKSRNELDKVAHGTDQRGEKHWNSILTTEDVLKIKAMLPTRSVIEIARLYSVSPSTIDDIRRGCTWAWLD